MVKEVSDKIVVILLIVAIVISVLGTFLVYTSASKDVGGTGKVIQNVETITKEGLPAGAVVGVRVLEKEGVVNG